MKIKVENNVPDLKVTGEETLGSITPGQTVKLGDHEYIVLGHKEENTVIITKKPVKRMVFGENGDYIKSYVRKYCNGEFYKELVKTVGEDNIVKHTVNLMAYDKTGEGKVVQDNVSILTTDLYNFYRAYLPSSRHWWTATRVSDEDSLGYARDVCCVGPDGDLYWRECNIYSFGVRPFCILNSSVNVG